MRESQYPSFNSGGGTTLGYVGDEHYIPSDNAVSYNLDGKTVSVEPDGTTYVDSGVGYKLSPDLSATLRMTEANAPGSLETAQSSTSGFDFKSLLESLSGVIGVVVQAKTQQDLLKANLDRAKIGLPPLNAQAYMPGVNVGVASDTQKMVFIVAGIAAGAIVLSALAGGRRR